MRTARDHAVQALVAVDRRDGWIAPEIERRRPTLDDPRDRALLTELGLGVVRARGTLDVVLGTVSRRPVRSLHTQIRAALRVGAYQLLYLDRTPAHAAVDHAVGWTRAALGAKRAGFVNGVLRGLTRALTGPAQGPQDPRRDLPRSDGTAVRFRDPVFPDPRRDGPATSASASPVPGGWWCAGWRTAATRPRSRLCAQGVVARPSRSVRAGRVTNWRRRSPSPASRSRPAASRRRCSFAGASRMRCRRWFAGLARVQDATSQAVVPLARLRSGAAVLDLCAAPGGKTLHAADVMGSGRIVACDVDTEKVQALAALTPEAGDVSLMAKQVSATGPLPFEAASFDAVFVDAPCSNTGVLRRRVDVRWRLRPKDINALADQQRSLLRRAAPLVRPEGVLVYSTCSLEPEENEAVIEAFLSAHPQYVQADQHACLPAADADGGFAVALCHP